MRILILSFLLLLASTVFGQRVYSNRTCYFGDVRKTEHLCILEVTAIDIAPKTVTFRSAAKTMLINLQGLDSRHKSDADSLFLYKAFLKKTPVTLGIKKNTQGEIISVGILEYPYKFLVFLIKEKPEDL